MRDADPFGSPPMDAPRRPSITLARRPVLVLAVLLLASGFALGQVVPLRDWLGGGSGEVVESPHDWRGAFANDFALNTTQTLVAMPEDDRLVRAGLGVLARRFGLELTPEKTDMPRQALRRADLLFFRNAQYGLLVYADGENGPIGFYFGKRDGAASAVATERRDGMNIAWWSSATHVYMLTGLAPESVLGTLATEFRSRFGG